jgi:alpha-1,6-mannosyltransferase
MGDHKAAMAPQKEPPFARDRSTVLDRWDLILGATMITYLIACPYTKVEESFNLQAMHDMLFHGGDLEHYDHFEFPGVVPRTFAGSLLVTFLAKPIWVVMEKLTLPAPMFKYLSLYLVRGVLGLLYVYSCGLFRRAFSLHFRGHQDRVLAACWTVVCATQFHLNFYATRTLPNTFALCLVLIAYHFWFLRKSYHAVAAFVFATVVFRSEIIVLFAPIAIELALRLPFVKLFLTGAMAGIVSLLFTILLDSYFWQRWLYPEGELLYFNTVLNKSHEWGTLPYYWYFAIAIPKTLMGACLLLPVGIYYEGTKLRGVGIPILVFLLLYSFLPHKELRFIFYVFPILNMIASLGLQHLWTRRRQHRLILLLASAVLAASLTASLGFAYISSKNYPGAEAIFKLHERADRSNSTFLVHLDVAPCQTGISRFLESHPRIQYDKKENVTDFLRFTHRITDKKSIYHYELPRDKDFVDGSQWQAIETILGFKNIRFSSSYPFLLLNMEPSLYIYRRTVD